MFQWESETDSSDKYLPSIYYVKIPWTKEPGQLPFLGSPKGLSTKPHCVLHAGVSTRLTAQSSEQNNQKSLMGERENQISNTNGALESDECSREKVKPWKATGSEEKHSSKQRSQEGWRLSEDLTGLRAWAGGEEGRGFQAEGSSRAPAWVRKRSWLPCLGKTSRTVGGKEEWAQLGLRADEGSDHETPQAKEGTCNSLLRDVWAVRAFGVEACGSWLWI